MSVLQTPAGTQPLATDEHVARLAEYLHSRRMRCTPERIAMLEGIMSTSGHFTTDEFHESLESQGFHVSKASVYNTLQLFVDYGIVRRHNFNSRGASYERIAISARDSGVHHHLICTSCGYIKEVRDPELTKILEKKRFTGFNISYISLSVYGLCSRCARSKKKAVSKKSGNNK